MSLLSELKPRQGAKRPRHRVGRGESSGWGKTAGRGHKGQKARSSFNILRGFEGGQMPLHRRSPKWGFTQRVRTRYHLVHLADLEEKFKVGEEITPDTLLQKKMIRNLHQPVKVLSDGELNSSFNISAHAASEAAKKKIEAAKGTFNLLPWKQKKEG